MIRCNTTTLKYANKAKLDTISNFVDRYTNMVKKYINIIWNDDPLDVHTLIDNKICQTISTDVDFDSRIRQCAAKQASSIVRAVTSKKRKQLYKLGQLQREGKNTKYLQRKIDNNPLKRPEIENLNVELDSRFIDFQEGNKFDLFVCIKQIGNKEKVIIPVKYNKVINKWRKLGKLKPSIRLNKNSLTLYFDIPENTKQGTNKVGADQGVTTCLTLSDGQATKKNEHGHDLSSISKTLARRKKGGKGFRRTQSHRKNYINWSINQLNFSDIKEVVLEKIINLRKGKRSSRYLSHWTYTLIKDKLVRFSEDKGFALTEQDNKFRSQRCSECEWTHKSNRKGKTFKCKHCGFITDSDLNAASNHEIVLAEIPPQVWRQRLNRSVGFFWHNDKIIVGDERIVRHVKKPDFNVFQGN